MCLALALEQKRYLQLCEDQRFGVRLEMEVLILLRRCRVLGELPQRRRVLDFR